MRPALIRRLGGLSLPFSLFAVFLTGCDIDDAVRFSDYLFSGGGRTLNMQGGAGRNIGSESFVLERYFFIGGNAPDGAAGNGGIVNILNLNGISVAAGTADAGGNGMVFLDGAPLLVTNGQAGL